MAGFSVGIVGLPNVGKSTLFNALMQREIAKVGRHPFTTISPNKGVIAVPDEKLTTLQKLVAQERGVAPKDIEIRPATIEFVDIAGLVKGAAQGEGLGNQFLSHIKEVDLILHVLRQFENQDIPHISGRIDVVADAAVVDLELILADFEVVAKALEERKKKKLQEKEAREELLVLEKVKKILEEGKPAVSAGLEEEELKIIKSFNLLTLKPVIYILNIEEKYLKEQEKLPKPDIKEEIIIPICVKLASEIYQLKEEERREYLRAWGIESTGLERVITTAYKTLGLITFYTLKGGEIISAWPVKEGATALQGACLIHSDFGKRFVGAEVINWQEFVKIGSWQKAKEKGLLKFEGRSYTIKDGDVVEFKLN